MVYQFNRVYERYLGQGADYSGIKKKYNDLVPGMEERLREADVILSKGQGNSKSLTEQGYHVFYELLCKYYQTIMILIQILQEGVMADSIIGDERLRKQLDFVLEIDKEKNVFRQTHLSGHGRNENDAEHAWHMAVMAYLLKEYSNEPVDIARVMIMCLIHDVVEIDAGDTYAYDKEGLATQKERENAAKERIFSLLPDDQKEELASIFDEFEANESAEAKFAHAMDNLQPLLLNDSNGGSDWLEHGVDAETVYSRHIRTKEGSESLFELSDTILKSNIAEGSLKK